MQVIFFLNTLFVAIFLSVTELSKKYPRLFRRQHIFYMRVAIPRDIQNVTLRKEFI